MWFKKKSQISGYNPNTAYDGSDWRTVNKNESWSVSSTLPSAADANNYFYLPALGEYDDGQLNNVGSFGKYWSSSANSQYVDQAYTLFFDSGIVGVNYRNRRYGFRVGGFE